MKTKLVAFDVYGTFLCSYDPEYQLPIRKGFFDLITWLWSNNIGVVTTSDANLDVLKCDLEEYKVPLELFSSMHKMEPGVPKDYREILNYYGIELDELIVFGDLQEIDIDSAIKIGCHGHLVPPYSSWNDSFDMMSLVDHIP